MYSSMLANLDKEQKNSLPHSWLYSAIKNSTTALPGENKRNSLFWANSNCQQTVSKIRIEKKKRKKFTLSVASKLKKTQDLNFLEINFRFLVIYTNIYSLTWPKYKIQPKSKPFSFQMQLIWSLKFFGIFGDQCYEESAQECSKTKKSSFVQNTSTLQTCKKVPKPKAIWFLLLKKYFRPTKQQY